MKHDNVGHQRLILHALGTHICPVVNKQIYSLMLCCIWQPLSLFKLVQVIGLVDVFTADLSLDRFHDLWVFYNLKLSRFDHLVTIVIVTACFFWMYGGMIIFWFSSSFAQLLGHAFYGYWSWKVDENAETVRGQGPVLGLPDFERTQSEYCNNAGLHTLTNIFSWIALCLQYIHAAGIIHRVSTVVSVLNTYVNMYFSLRNH